MTLNICEGIGVDMEKLFTCERVNEFIRISTPFKLPDGDLIDLFFKEKEDCYVITDLGETLGWLYLQTSSRTMPKNQEIIINDILNSHNVGLRNGMFVVYFKKNESLSKSIFRLCQAITRVADTNKKSKSKHNKSLNEEVEDLLIEEEIHYIKNQTLIGESGKNRWIDFHVDNLNKDILINLVSTPSRRIVSTRVDKVFVTWSDINNLYKERRYHFVSLIDDSKEAIEDNEISILNRVSQVVKWSSVRNFNEVIQQSVGLA